MLTLLEIIGELFGISRISYGKHGNEVEFGRNIEFSACRLGIETGHLMDGQTQEFCLYAQVSDRLSEIVLRPWILRSVLQYTSCDGENKDRNGMCPSLVFLCQRREKSAEWLWFLSGDKKKAPRLPVRAGRRPASSLEEARKLPRFYPGR